MLLLDEFHLVRRRPKRGVSGAGGTFFVVLGAGSADHHDASRCVRFGFDADRR